ncbi:cohesin domain-containing protein [Paenibacillus hunanensis]|uniref:cohesin domain-containing protein n=1 Tax=Paenibacillus hunanensis TaxID=539262 RepID=UPI002A6A0B77|nr:cohesin domain-containing protein [Paenibacillus hunanensis]WPP41199.1 cohesin domain-containing protein [Paenibacillus hunanensis]
MRMKFALGLLCTLLLSMTFAFNTASAKSVLRHEMDTNPFNRGTVSNGIWSDTNSDTSSTASYTGANTAVWNNAWAYDNTKDYELVAKYNIIATGANSAAQLDLGLVKIGYIRTDTKDWLIKGISIRDGNSWQNISMDTTGNHEWRVSYQADKNFIIYKDGTEVYRNKISSLIPSKTFLIDNIVRNSTASIDYIYINDVIAPVAPMNLKATAKDTTALLTWDASNVATNYTVSRSVYAEGPFEQIAQNIKETTFNDTAVKAGNTYYYTVKAINESGTSPASNIASVTFEAPRIPLLDVIIAPETIKVGETFTADIALKNVQDIYAEDFSLSYDPTLVQYVGYEAVTGYKVYNETKDTPGALLPARVNPS